MEQSNVYTALGWIICVGAGGAAYYYYAGNDRRQREFRGRGRPNLPRAAEVAAPITEPVKKKKQQDRPKPVNRGSDPEVRVAPHVYTEREEKEDMSWAHQLAQKKQGTTLAPPARAANRQKTVKQNNANNRAAELSADSSNGDADDDLSPAVSPALNGEDLSGRNVSDMLEPAAPGPSVLKINEATNPKKHKPKQQPKVVEQETKKQRQNRKKAEEKKAQREADEAERKVLAEKQRRGAREARNEPAKNGLGIASTPTSSAWKEQSNGTAAAASTNGQLLDTFANDDTTTTESTAPTSVSTSPVQPVAKGEWWNRSMPSEEEQQRMLLEQDENTWTTVSTKGKKGNRQANGGAVQPIEVS